MKWGICSMMIVSIGYVLSIWLRQGLTAFVPEELQTNSKIVNGTISTSSSTNGTSTVVDNYEMLEEDGEEKDGDYGKGEGKNDNSGLSTDEETTEATIEDTSVLPASGVVQREAMATDGDSEPTEAATLKTTADPTTQPTKAPTDAEAPITTKPSPSRTESPTNPARAPEAEAGTKPAEEGEGEEEAEEEGEEEAGGAEEEGDDGEVLPELVGEDEEEETTAVEPTTTAVVVKSNLRTTMHNNSNKTDTDDKRPIMVLHIGPHKTATSTIQCEITWYRSLLHNKNWIYMERQYKECKRRNSIRLAKYNIDTRKHIIPCLDSHSASRPCNTKRSWKEFEAKLAMVANDGLNAIISDEAFARMQINDERLGLLFGTIQKYFRLRVVVVYRHYYSWLLSKYNEDFKPLKRRPEFHKWPEMGGHRILPYWKWYANNEHSIQQELKQDKSAGVGKGYQLAADRFGIHPVTYLKQRWTDPDIPMAPKPEDFYIVDMHDPHAGKDMTVHFLRQAMSSDLAQALVDYKQRQTRKHIPSRENPSLDLDLNMLTYQAREKGLFPKTKSMSRMKVSHYVEQNFMKTLQFTSDGLPKLCLEENDLQKYLNRSLAYDEIVYGEASEIRERQHRDGFWDTNRRHKFCNLHTEQLLEMDAVKGFFRSLRSLIH